MLEIKTVKSEKKLKQLFNILSEIFYDDAVKIKNIIIQCLKDMKK